MTSRHQRAEPTGISVRRLRLASGIVLFIYIFSHLLNHALGLISLNLAERALAIAKDVWYSVPGTLLLYGAGCCSRVSCIAYSLCQAALAFTADRIRAARSGF